MILSILLSIFISCQCLNEPCSFVHSFFLFAYSVTIVALSYVTDTITSVTQVYKQWDNLQALNSPRPAITTLIFYYISIHLLYNFRQCCSPEFFIFILIDAAGTVNARCIFQANYFIIYILYVGHH